MSFRGDDRGVSVQVGAIVLLGFLVVALSLYQATVVPQQNRGVEFGHSQTVQNQLVDVRNALVRAATTGTAQPSTVDLGVRYPPRAFFVNPPPATGRLATHGTADPSVAVTVENATAVDAETRDYWNGSRVARYGTGSLAYRPGYNVYRGAPTTVYENTVLYDRLARGNRTATDQALVDGRTVTLVLLNGSRSASGVSATAVEARPLSVSTRVVTVRNDAANVTVRLPTALPAGEWDALLRDEPAVAHDVVPAPSGSGSVLELTLFRGVTYELRVARVGVGTARGDAEPAYVVPVTELDGSIPADETRPVVAEVRDRFNNPVSDAAVTATVTSDGAASGGTLDNGTTTGTLVTARTDAEGRVRFAFEATNPAVEPTVNVSIAGGARPHRRVRYRDLSVVPGDGSGPGTGTTGTDELNPSRDGRVALVAESAVGGSGSTDVTLKLQNRTGAARPVHLAAARVSFFHAGTNQAPPAAVELHEGATASGAPRAVLDVGGNVTDVRPRVAMPGRSTNRSVTLRFLEPDGSPQNNAVNREDFYVLTLRFEHAGTFTYFVSHPK
jgi:hypothetical protein